MSELKYKALLTMLMNATKEACDGLKYKDGEGDVRVDLENALFYVKRNLDDFKMFPLCGYGDVGKNSWVFRDWC